MTVEVEAVEELGAAAYLHGVARLGESSAPVIVRWDVRSGIEPGTSVRVGAPAARMHLFDPGTGERF